MRGINVKNTMLMHAAELLAPHYCMSCGAAGSVLCIRCVCDITDESYDGCLICRHPASSGVCGRCSPPYSRAWCCDERRGVLKEVIDAYKFQRLKAAALPLARMLAEVTPELPKDTVVTSIPTIRAHIRKRGYDHARLIAREYARLKRCRFAILLDRTSEFAQLGASKKAREEHARDAFRVRQIPTNCEYVCLIDDILTTGSTLHHAARVLREAGVREVWVGVIARQPLDE